VGTVQPDGKLTTRWQERRYAAQGQFFNRGRHHAAWLRALGGVKSHIDHYAALFAEAGLAMSLDDHRGFGTSDGAPRQEVDPYRQLADWRDAITFAESQPEFDAERGLGVWGSKALYSARGATTLEAM
jgi:hypothetical protein